MSWSPKARVSFHVSLTSVTIQVYQRRAPRPGLAAVTCCYLFLTTSLQGSHWSRGEAHGGYGLGNWTLLSTHVACARRVHSAQVEAELALVFRCAARAHSGLSHGHSSQPGSGGRVRSRRVLCPHGRGGATLPPNSLCAPVPALIFATWFPDPTPQPLPCCLCPVLVNHGGGTAPSPAWAPGSEAPAERVSSSQEAGPPPPPPQVPEIIEHAYHHVHGAREAAAQQTIGKVLHVLAQSYTDEVVLTLFEMEEQSQRWVGPPGGGGGEAPRLCRSAYA